MNSKFKESAILEGTLQYYCLVCEKYLVSEKELASHLENPDHKTSMSTSNYLDQYIDDRIRRVKKGYYCELCNEYLTTTLLADFHVTDAEHIKKKGFQFLRRSMNNNDIIVYKNVGITRDAWNGIIQNRCIICDIQVRCTEDHIATEAHLFQLVLIEVEFGINNGVYRMLNDIFQCLTCNEVYPTTIMPEATIANHFLQFRHRVLYEKSELIARERSNSQGSSGNTSNAAEDIANDDELQDEENQEAGNGQVDEGSASMQLDEASNDHSKPFDLNRLTAALGGHTFKKEDVATFIQSFLVVERPHQEERDIIINETMLVEYFSYYGLKQFDSSWRCDVCDLDLTDDNIHDHRFSLEHEIGLAKVKIITLESVQNEFIREIRENVYHCGICNTVTDNIDEMMQHLKSLPHSNERASAEWRLNLYRHR